MIIMTLYCAHRSYCLWPSSSISGRGTLTTCWWGTTIGGNWVQSIWTPCVTWEERRIEKTTILREDKTTLWHINECEMWKPAVDKVQILAVNLFPNIGEFNAWCVLVLGATYVCAWLSGRGPGCRDTEPAPTLDTALMGWLVTIMKTPGF